MDIYIYTNIYIYIDKTYMYIYIYTYIYIYIEREREIERYLCIEMFTFCTVYLKLNIAIRTSSRRTWEGISC